MPNKPKPIKRQWVPERVAFGRRKDNSKFYNSWKWRKKSKSYKTKHPFCECEDCIKNNVVKIANVVDNIKGLTFLLENNLNPFDDAELQSMSSECHNKKSGRDAHGGGRVKKL